MVRQYHIYDCGDNRIGVVVSPTEINTLHTVIVAPLTDTLRKLPFYVPIRHNDQAWAVACDQLQSVDRYTLGAELGVMSAQEADALRKVLLTMFTV